MDEKNRGRISGQTLKLIACISMFIDHIGAIILESLPEAEMGYIICRLIGRISFPIFCFLMAEGIRHTSSKKRYVLRMAAFAVLSEVPYDIAFTGQTFAWTAQNVFFTLCLGLLALCAMEGVSQGGFKRTLRYSCDIIIIIIFGAVNELILHGSYGFIGTFTMAAAYLIPKKEDAYMAECLTLTAMSYSEISSFLALPFIHLYSGERGIGCKGPFYAFYPMHLTLLSIIAMRMNS